MSVAYRAAIAGVGVTAFGKLPGRTSWSLQAEAVKRALDDAGLNKSDIDGLLTQPPFSEPLLLHAEQLGGALGLRVNYISQKSIGGATPVALVAEAAFAVAAGLCEVAVCVYGENGRTGFPMLFGKAQMGQGQIAADQIAYGVAGGPVMEARAAQRYMHDYGVTHEMLGAVAIAIRDHATRNPAALYRDPMTMEEYLSAPFVAEPLRARDCAIGPWGDGAVAVIVTTAERARDCATAPAYIGGIGVAANLEALSDPQHYTHFAGTRAAETAFRLAGIDTADVDVVQFYDCFTSTVLITVEDYGFCKKGEGGPF
ncbi:MAG: thiolase family protein, partial [Actinomycetota bacterium]